MTETDEVKPFSVKVPQTAFPFTAELGDGTVVFCPGMTLRDYFAAQALSGILARQGYAEIIAAKISYDFADAMLECRGVDR